MEKILERDVIGFLNDCRANSVTQLLESEEASDLAEEAKKSDIKFKDNVDLAFFKTIYAITDKANKNKCRLPREVVEKALSGLAHKPVDIDHIRNLVTGHYIKGKLDSNKIISYGVFYKSNFADEWEEAQRLFKKGKLTTSFEIRCPKSKREYHSDGTFSLRSINFAGGALLFTTKPAYSEAKVLEIAKRNILPETDLIYSSEEIITSDLGKATIEESIEQAQLPKAVTDCVKKKIKAGTKPADAVKSCWKEYKEKTKANVDSLIDQFDGKEVNEKDMEELKVAVSLDNIYDIDTIRRIVGGLTCPECEKKKEDEQYEIRLKIIGLDFENQKALLKCNKCSKKYSVSLVIKPKLEKAEFDKILEEAEIVDEECVIDVADMDVFEQLLIAYSEGEEKELEEAARLTYEQRKALPDASFAVVVKVKDKRTGDLRKIRMFPINDEAHVRNALARLGQPAPQATLRSLGVNIESVKKKILKKAKQLKMTTLLEKYEKGGNGSMEDKTKKELAEKIKKLGLPEDATKEQIEAKEKELAEKAKDEKIKDLEIKIKALEKALEDNKVDVEKIKKDAVKVAKLKEELGDYAKDLKDEDFLNDEKISALKTKKENDELNAKVKELNAKIEKAGITDPDPTGHDDPEENAAEETEKIDTAAYGAKKEK